MIREIDCCIYLFILISELNPSFHISSEVPSFYKVRLSCFVNFGLTSTSPLSFIENNSSSPIFFY